MSSGVGVTGSVSPSIASRPISKKKSSSPAGVTTINIRVVFDPVFLKECNEPLARVTQAPEVAVKLRPSAWSPTTQIDRPSPATMTPLFIDAVHPSPRQRSAGCRLPRLHRWWGGDLDGSSRTPSLSPGSVSRCIPSSARACASPVNPPDLHDPDGRSHRPQSLRLLPCFPAQNGQKGQSSPSGKSSPSSWRQPMFPALAAIDLTPCSLKNSWISRLTFGLVVTSVATHRMMIGSAAGDTITPAAILVVVLASGPERATVPIGDSGRFLCLPRRPVIAGDGRDARAATSFGRQQCLYFFPLPQGQGSLRETRSRSMAHLQPDARPSLVHRIEVKPGGIKANADRSIS